MVPSCHPFEVAEPVDQISCPFFSTSGGLFQRLEFLHSPVDVFLAMIQELGTVCRVGYMYLFD